MVDLQAGGIMMPRMLGYCFNCTRPETVCICNAGDYAMVVTPTVGGYWVHATVDGKDMSMRHVGRSKSAAMSAFQLMVDEVAS